jgi:hypothetical protein
MADPERCEEKRGPEGGWRLVRRSKSRRRQYRVWHGGGSRATRAPHNRVTDGVIRRMIDFPHCEASPNAQDARSGHCRWLCIGHPRAVQGGESREGPRRPGGRGTFVHLTGANTRHPAGTVDAFPDIDGRRQLTLASLRNRSGRLTAYSFETTIEVNQSGNPGTARAPRQCPLSGAIRRTYTH